MLFIGLVFFMLPSWASLTPSYIRESALKHHPMVKASVERFMAGQDSFKAAKGAFDTKLVSEHYRVSSGMWARTFTDVMLERPIPIANSKIYGGYSYGFNGLFPPQFSTVSTNSGGSPRIGLSTSLWRYRSIDPQRAAVKNTLYDSKISEGEKYLVQWDITRMAETAYWEWVTSGKVQSVYESLLKLGEARSDYLTSREKRGDAPKILIRENEQYVANRKAALQAAKERRMRAEYGLSLFLRDIEGNPILPAENEDFETYPENFSVFLQQIESSHPVEELSRRRPDLKNLGLTLEKAQVDVELALHDLKPKFDFWGDYTRNIGNEDPTNPPHIWSFGLKLEIPIERNLGNGNISAAKNRQRALQNELKLAHDNFRVEILSAKRALVMQNDQVLQTEIELARAKELLEAESIKFRSGGSNLFLVNQREEAVANAEASWYESKLVFLTTMLSYQALTSKTPD